MRVGIANVQVPFVRGGAELLAENLCSALKLAGHQAEIISIPFKWYPIEIIPQQILACSLIDLEESCGIAIDRIIGLKFPTYLVPHPNKVMWILHQHRSAYDLWERRMGDFYGTPNGDAIKKIVEEADKQAIPLAQNVMTISKNVSKRLKTFCDIDSTPLYHPPPFAEYYKTSDSEDFLLMPSRLNSLKRQDLVIDALFLTKRDVRVCFMGAADDVEYGVRLQQRSAALSTGRVVWRGSVSDQEKLRLFETCLGVIFPPVDEDYGYVTLEAMLSSKPTITCTDSGGPLEFLVDGETGIICAPSAHAIAEAMDKLWMDRTRAKRYGEAALAHYRDLKLNWSRVVDCLLA